MQISQQPRTEAPASTQAPNATPANNAGSNTGGSGGGLIGGIIGGVTGIIGMMGNRRRETRARKNQELLMKQQMEYQERLNATAHQRQKEMWDYTTEEQYAKQMAGLKKAGLNPALMYEGQGQGGTTGNVGAGAASGGHAATPAYASMDIANQMAQAAEIELMMAQAKKAEAEASSIRGEEGTIGESQINKLAQETTSEQLKQKLLEAQKITETQRSGLVMNEAIKTAEEIVRLSRENHIGEETIDAVVNEIKAKSAGADIVNELNRSRIKLTETQDKQLEEAIAQKWAEIDLHDTEVNIKIAQTIINGITGIGGLIQAGRLAEAMRKGKQATEKAWGEGFKDGVEQMKQ